MTMAEDDPFESIVEGLNLNTDTSEVTDVTKLSDSELLNLRHVLSADLRDSSEALFPHSQSARDKHSLRNAVQIEIQKRFIDG